jgi:hypothetical protein
MRAWLVLCVVELLFALFLTGCRDDSEPLLRFRDGHDNGSRVSGDSQPFHREIMSEFEVGKSWRF